MRYSYNWLKEFLEFEIAPEELLDKLVSIGLPIESKEEKDKDILFELEIPANRGDLLSIFGLAREISSAFYQKRPALSTKEVSAEVSDRIEISIENREDCPFYSCCLVKGVKVGSSPEWLVEKINKAGARSVNNVVDITNYLLFELGQPLHAFNLRKIEGNLLVRRGLSSESLITIDNEKRELREKLIIADSKKPLAIAGIMGGKESEVTEDTEAILLESAYFNPPLIRKGRRELNIQTESSYRFERGVDPAGVLLSLKKAVSLVQEICEGKPSSIFSSGELPFPQKNSLSLRLSRLSQISGLSIPEKEVEKIICSLAEQSLPLHKEGIKKEEDRFTVTIPSFRRDLEEEIDLIEEVVRFYGYENLPKSLPEVTLTFPKLPKDKEIIEQIKDRLSILGLKEICNLSFSSPIFEKERAVKILNPLNKEEDYLQDSLLPNLLKTFQFNFSHGNRELFLFEIGKVFQKEKSFRESRHLSMGIFPGDFLKLKGIIESLWEKIGLSKLSFSFSSYKHPFLEKESSVSIRFGEREIGILGEVSEPILLAFQIKEKGLFLSELNLEEILPQIEIRKEFKPFSKYPYVRRDFSVIIPREIGWEEISSSIYKLSALVKEVRVFDLYKGEEIPKDYQGLSFSVILSSEERTLTGEEVKDLEKKIEKELEKRDITIRKG